MPIFLLIFMWKFFKGVFILMLPIAYFPFFFKFYFIFKLYIIVLVLPNIKMNPPQVYMCSPSWTLLPPPSPFHPSGSSQCTSPKCFWTHTNYGFVSSTLPSLSDQGPNDFYVAKSDDTFLVLILISLKNITHFLHLDSSGNHTLIVFILNIWLFLLNAPC